MKTYWTIKYFPCRFALELFCCTPTIQVYIDVKCNKKSKHYRSAKEIIHYIEYNKVNKM